MQSSPLLSFGLPIVLCMIMLGLGLSLRMNDFRQVIARPYPVAVGLACQIAILPAICFVLVYASGLPPEICVGMMLLAASPGGTTSALYTHLARGDVALSMSLSGVTSLMSLFTLPVIANVSLYAFMGGTEEVSLGLAKVFQMFAIAIVPALLGIMIHHRFPDLARRLEKPVKTLATAFLAAVILFAFLGQWRLLLEWGTTVGVLAIVFCAISLGVGYYVPRLLAVGRKQAIALSMSIGMHNAALVIALALSEHMLNSPEMAIPPAAYGLFAYFLAAGFAWWLSRPGRSERTGTA